jgi:hypothetical protein
MKEVKPLHQINNPIFHISINPTYTWQQYEKTFGIEELEYIHIEDEVEN